MMGRRKKSNEIAPVVGAAFGSYIRSLRADCSAAEIARRADISRSYLAKLEAGAVERPDPTVIVGLARALDVDPEMLQTSVAQGQDEAPAQVLAALRSTQAELSNVRQMLDASCHQAREKLIHLTLPVDDILKEAGKALGREDVRFARALLQGLLASLDGAAGEAAVQARMGLSDAAHLEGMANDAIREAKHALGILQSLPQVSTERADLHIGLLYRIAALETDLGKATAPLKAINEAIALLEVVEKSQPERIKSCPHLAELLRVRGVIHSVASLWPKAEEDFQNALQLAANMDLCRIEAITYSDICRLRIRQGRFDKALESCLESLRLRATLSNDQRGHAHCYGHLAEIALEERESLADLFLENPLPQGADEVDHLMDLVMRTAESSEANNDNRVVADASLMLAALSARQRPENGSIIDALNHARHALAIFEGVDDARNAAEARLLMAGLLARNGWTGRATLEAQRVLDFAARNELFLLQARARRRLGIIFARDGDLGEARNQLGRSWRLLTDSEFGVEDEYERERSRYALHAFLERFGSDRDRMWSNAHGLFPVAHSLPANSQDEGSTQNLFLEEIWASAAD